MNDERSDWMDFSECESGRILNDNNNMYILCERKMNEMNVFLFFSCVVEKFDWIVTFSFGINLEQVMGKQNHKWTTKKNKIGAKLNRKIPKWCVLFLGDKFYAFS